jgi:multiple sugar transport system permease protein
MRARGWRFGWRERRALAGLLFVLPTWLVWLFWTALPTVSTIWLSFTNWNLLQAPIWVGLDNYAKAVEDPLFLLSFRNSVIYAAVFTPVGVGIALALSIMIDNTERLREYFRVSYFLPVVTSVAATSILWKWLYQPGFGLINYSLSLVGINGPGWLNDQSTALLAVGIMGTWGGVGFTIVLFLAGLQAIPPSLYEAGEIDGATGLQRVWFITLPLLRPTALFVSVISIANAFQVFAQIFIMTKGGPAYSSSVLAYYLYIMAFQRFQMGYAAAIAMAIFLLVLVVTIVQLKLFRQNEAD